MAIFGDFQSIKKQTPQSERLQKAMEFVADLGEAAQSPLRQKAEQLKPGESFEVTLEGKDLFAILQAYEPRERKDGQFEAHKEYTDIQLLLRGEEYIETCPLADLSTHPSYDQNNNAFFPLTNGSTTRLHLKPGSVGILFPPDAHAPCLRSGPTGGVNIKVVVKIRNAA